LSTDGVVSSNGWDDLTGVLDGNVWVMSLVRAFGVNR
jgi:hypothetical protein